MHFTVSVFSQKPLILGALSDEPAINDTSGEGRSQHHRCCWTEEWKATTFYDPPHHINFTMGSLVCTRKVWTEETTWRRGGINHWDIFRGPAIFCVIYLFNFISCISPSTHQQSVSEDPALKRSASQYTTRNQFQQAAMKKKRRESGQSSGER